MFQLSLLIEGLGVVGQSILPRSIREKNGTMRLWAAWHLVVFAGMMKYYGDNYEVEIEKFKSVAFEFQGLQILALYLCLPLAVSFVLAQAHRELRKQLGA
jgi:cAMP phosphodiesterase